MCIVLQQYLYVIYALIYKCIDNIDLGLIQLVTHLTFFGINIVFHWEDEKKNEGKNAGSQIISWLGHMVLIWLKKNLKIKLEIGWNIKKNDIASFTVCPMNTYSCLLIYLGDLLFYNSKFSFIGELLLECNF